MRHFLALFCAVLTLCTGADALSNTADGPGFKGDRIVIFRDESAAFAAFEEKVLRDPEVAAFMSQHFAVYMVETESPQAWALPLFGGARPEPRVVIFAPRLEGLTLVLQPTLGNSLLLTQMRALNRASTMQDFHAAIGGFVGPTTENMTAWAREFYPAITEPGSVPGDLLIGFVISRDMKVVQHSVDIGKREGSVLAQLRRMLPRANILERPVSSGASCFGGFDSNGAKYGRYCVTWAVASE